MGLEQEGCQQRPGAAHTHPVAPSTDVARGASAAWEQQPIRGPRGLKASLPERGGSLATGQEEALPPKMPNCSYVDWEHLHTFLYISPFSKCRPSFRDWSARSSINSAVSSNTGPTTHPHLKNSPRRPRGDLLPQRDAAAFLVLQAHVGTSWLPPPERVGVPLTVAPFLPIHRRGRLTLAAVEVKRDKLGGAGLCSGLLGCYYHPQQDPHTFSAATFQGGCKEKVGARRETVLTL